MKLTRMYWIVAISLLQITTSFNRAIAQNPSTPSSTPPVPGRQTTPGGGQQSANPPTPSPTLPDNRTRPGGSLSSPDSTCPPTKQPLTALIPPQNPVITTNATLRISFYVPYGSDTVQKGEFSLVTQDEKTRIYKTQITLSPTPGIISIDVPSEPEYALTEGQYYHWYFKLYCQGNDSSSNDLAVNGWVQRAPLTPERERQVAEFSPEVWYDSVANLRDLLQDSPEDETLQNSWETLLRSINAEELISEPFVDSATIQPN
ncbi:DUF928 domain-containing protein [Lusitaniella coriacea LEGE 07157]|uniref:DUF928 domain-containing protein n=1 Tax=Lusitaniella coriacea LEGE 07157 TaxID=945747 RepID=A0A8J7DW88_9CYAN|nr:DUF928 domain-containing protein [Lusitaniella coriacea]MBE9115938.1 DUF928 domain-containing protein [Lusitaniella coriacea LEGE 07157]